METRSRFHNALTRGHVPELVRLRLRPTLNRRGQPVVIEGDTAMVARMTRSDGASRAIRVPRSPDWDDSWLDQYAAIAESLPRAAGNLVPGAIEVLGQGITLGTATYPAVEMEWIDGPTLLRAADRAALHGNAAVLSALAASLRNLADGFREVNVVHGDLAADNLIVRRDGKIAAVDLDTISWVGGPSDPKGETTAAYRFPHGQVSRAQGDAFAILVQFVSLKVLADSPRLRASHGDSPETHGGALLFSAWDLSDPGSSRAFRDIRPELGPDARDLLDLLRDACEGSPGDLPGILARAVNPAPVSSSWSTPAPEPATKTWDVSRVIERLRREESTPVVTPAPVASDDVYPDLSIPDDLVAERQRLREAIEAGDEANIMRQVVKLADDPVTQLYKLDVEHVLSERYRSRIAEAARQHRDDQVVHLAGEAADRQLPLPAGARRSVRTAMERADVRERLERALATNDREALADLAVSGDLVVLGDTDRSTLKRVLQALEWPNLQRALESDDDRLILEAFDEELFDAGAALPAAAHDRVMLAKDRLAWMEQVRRALKQRDVDTLTRLSGSSPRGAMGRLGKGERARAERLLRRKAALDALEQAMRHGNDARILAALHDVEDSGARIEDRMTWTTIRNVVERASLVEKIIAAATAEPVDDRALAHLLPVAKTMGLMADPAFQGEHAWSKLEAMVTRGAAVRRIRTALATDDDRAIRQAAYPDIAGALNALTAAEKARVEAARERRVVR